MLLKLDLERRLLLAAVCTVVQLLLVGLLLDWVFRLDRWEVVLAMMVSMTLIAGYFGHPAHQVRYPGVWLRSIAAVWAGSWLVAMLALGMIVRVRPWYTPQYAIPLLGMILGNTLNGVSLGLDRLGSELVGQSRPGRGTAGAGRDALGGRGRSIQQAVRTGLVPTINAMMVVGHREPARHDDRSAPGGHEPDRGGQVPDRDHVPDRVGNGARNGFRGLAQLSQALQQGSQFLDAFWKNAGASRGAIRRSAFGKREVQGRVREFRVGRGLRARLTAIIQDPAVVRHWPIST